jgi:hypothetical protein
MNHAQQSQGYYAQSQVRGRSKKSVRNMSLTRKAGFGIGNCTTVSKVNPNNYQRERARQARLGALHREWVLSHTAKQIFKLIAE